MTCVYPACAGIDLLPELLNRTFKGLPRMRGDRPLYNVRLKLVSQFTPHARGSTERTVAVERDIKVYPACAGIDPAASTASQASSRLPRMRGDRPPQVSVSCERYPFTPHARGSTERGERLKTLDSLPRMPGIDPLDYHVNHFPWGLPRMRIDLCYDMGILEGQRLPRMRGDRPYLVVKVRKCGWFTPHARGSTSRVGRSCPKKSVYPACAGIDHPHFLNKVPDLGLPRMRGDRPQVGRQLERKRTFTPHARGSTWRAYQDALARSVYPACAGIDPTFKNDSRASSCLPRMRGDRPLWATLIRLPLLFTPHARGSTSAIIIYSCYLFVYPACAGIDPGRARR